MTVVPKDPVIAALADEFAAIDALASELGPDDWTAMSPCPGWDVRANLSHMIGTESALAGQSAPDVDGGAEPAPAPHVRNDIGAANERWVRGLAALPPDELIGRFRTITTERLAALRAMPQDDWDAEGFTPAGRDTYGRFMRIRVFDCWMHEQDMRDAVGRPGHEAGPVVDLALDEMVSALGFVVGKKAGAPKGSSVTFVLTGDPERTVHVEVGDRAAVVSGLSGPPTVTLRMPAGVFTRLGGGRVTAAAVTDQVEITGDEALGHAILDNFGYTI